MTTPEIINFNKLRITPVYLVFHDEEGLSKSLAFGEVLHKAIETCLHRIDEENRNSGKNEIEFAAKTLTEQQIGGSELLSEMRNSFPRGYSIAWEQAPIEPFTTIRLSLFGKFAKLLPYLLPRLPNIFASVGYSNIQFVSASDALLQAIELKRGKLSPAPEVVKLHHFSIPHNNIKHIALSLHSPVKLYKTQKHNFNMGFGDFVYHLLKRMMILQYLYCDGPLPDMKLLKEYCTGFNFAVKTVKIDLALHNQKLTKDMWLEGYTGTIHYQILDENIKPLIPILKAGEYVQVGSATNYGMGKYQLKHEYHRII